jgi:histidinol-phosphate aminotransferase
MARFLLEEVKDDLLGRGYSRRQMMRIGMMLGGASALTAFNGEMAWAQSEDAGMKAAPAKTRIGGNEWPTGPFAAGVAAGSAIFSQSNRYSPHDEHGDFIRAISQAENVPEDHISGWPGSTEGLLRTLVAFCSPTRGLVQATPGYDNPSATAKYLQAPFHAVPLKADYSHDVRAMLAADPNAGVYYVCNPNNPTATVTPQADIEWLVENKPAGSVVIVDEAYIHGTDDYPNNTCSHLVAQGKDVVVMRTFSKVFGMAGARLGFLMARPDLQKKLVLYDTGGPNPVMSLPAMVCGTVSLKQQAEIAKRRKEMMETRAMTVDFLRKANLKLIGPSQANFLMIDWKTRNAKDMQAAFRAEGVLIAGPRWPIWPTVSRVSIGSKQDMEAFFGAFKRVVSA